MWIVDSMARVPLKKLYLSLVATLGAAFLLLVFFFQLNPLLQPVIYMLIALSVCFVQRKDIRILRGALFVLGTLLLAYLLIPNYTFLFSLGLSLLAGKLIFYASLRFWKWLACSILFFLAVQITGVWQQIDFLGGLIPFQIYPLLHAAIFSFCVALSFLPYYLIKDSVLSAFESYTWQHSEPAGMAIHAKDLYQQVKLELRRQHFDERVLEELEEFSEKMIHLCHQLQEMNQVLLKIDPQFLAAEIADMRQRVETARDSFLKKNFERALLNREKQKEQQEALQLQAERIQAQILNYISALENVWFAYAHRHFTSSEQGTEGIEFLLQMTKNQAESVYETSEAYQKLV